MKAPLAVVLFLLLVTDISGYDQYRQQGDGVGAIYTATNGATKNQVVIYRVLTNGKLTRAGIINTGGVGVNSTQVDVLLSQGSLVVHSNYLFVVNAGSNSLSMFSINPKDATQLRLISVQPTNGQYPVSVTVNSKYACVLTGGRRTGIRFFTYNSTGLHLVRSFDRNLTAFVSHDTPLIDGQGAFGQILFSADDRCLIITRGGFISGPGGFLLFFPLTNNGARLALNPIKQLPPHSVGPFGMSLVGENGLLVTDADNETSRGVQTLRYNSTTGKISAGHFTLINSTKANVFCWSVFSPTIRNYYIVGLFPPAIVEINVNLNSASKPVKIIRIYPIPLSVGALDTTVVTIRGVDYLYVLGTEAHVINSYRLNGPGKAVSYQTVVVQRNAENLPKIVGIATYIQKHSSPGYYFSQ